MSSPSLGLQAYRDRTLAADDPRRQETYACGDMNTSLMRTARGRTIVLQHDVVSPRPYSRINMVSGTKGTFADYPPRLFLDGQKEHAWQGCTRRRAGPRAGSRTASRTRCGSSSAGPPSRGATAAWTT